MIVALIDICTGNQAYASIMAALLHKMKTGEGQHIEVSLFDTTLASLANTASNYLIGNEIPKRMVIFVYFFFLFLFLKNIYFYRELLIFLLFLIRVFKPKIVL